MTQTAGSIRAAEEIEKQGEHHLPQMVVIIDRYTHAAEMLAFIEKVAAWDFDGGHWKLEGEKIIKAQSEAFELIKKVKG